ncbi:MAG: aromatic ring hydroxylase [Nanoarchaeota archaeon]|nr:aromatic ring hydroxylase [Nanoarchaeota archaeon]|tara:strand:+ start:320 stop:607 length:288 start_codon:yes stop_codon:yes gene_type:complete
MLTKDLLIENVFKKYEDPELGVDVWTLGLIYNITVKDDAVTILLTFTTPFCPYGPQMVEDLEEAITQQGAQKVNIEITFDPPWQASEELRAMMGL